MSNRHLALEIIDIIRQKNKYKQASGSNEKDKYFAKKVVEVIKSSDSDFPKAAHIAYEIILDTRPKIDIVDFFNKIAAAELILSTLENKKISKTASEVADITELYLCELFEEILRR